jgi:hypothetical protein
MNSIKSRGAPVVAFGLQGEAPGVAMTRVPSLRNLCGIRTKIPAPAEFGRGTAGFDTVHALISWERNVQICDKGLTNARCRPPSIRSAGQRV